MPFQLTKIQKKIKVAIDKILFTSSTLLSKDPSLPGVSVASP